MEREVFHRSGNHSIYDNISKNTFTLERTTAPKKREQIDAFPNFWVFGFGNSEVPITVKTRGGEIIKTGKVAVFCPPFSLVHWCLPGVSVHFKLMASNVPLPPGIPEEPCVFSYEEQVLPTPSDLFGRLSKLESYTIIAKIEEPSAIARRAREAIVATYRTSKRLEQTALDLNVQPSEMSRAFKKAYGLTAIGYRNRLRILHAFWHILQGNTNIQEIAADSGFSDLSRFNKQFAGMMTASPTMFR